MAEEFILTKTPVEGQDLGKYVDLDKAFKVSDLEKEQLLEKLKEEEKIAGEFSKPSILEEKYFKEISNLEDQKLQDKLSYVSSLVGEPVVNKGLDDIGLRFDQARSVYFETRKAKFLDEYPEGEYTRIQVPTPDSDVPEYLEIYKTNKDDKQWGIINPYGRDIGEIGSVLGTLIDEQTAGEALGLLLPFKKASKFFRAVKAGAGSLFGIKTRKAVESLRGYGEEEFKGETFGDIDWAQAFQDSGDYLQALTASGFQFGTDVVAGKLTGQRSLSLVPDSPEIIRAAERLGLDPLVFGQLVNWTVLRKAYYQAGGIVGEPKEVLEKQLLELNTKLKEFAGGKRMTEGELLDVITKLENNMQTDMIFFKNTDVAMREANENLIKTIQDLNKFNARLNKSLISKAINFSEDSSISLKSLKDKGGIVRNSYVSQKFPGKPEVKKTIDPDSGEEIIEKIPTKKSVGGVPEEVQSLLDDIGKLPMAFNAVESKGKLVGLDALVKLREKAYKLTLSSDPKINAGGREIYDQIVKMFDVNQNYFQGSGEFLSMIKALDGQMSNAEKVNKFAFVKQSLSENFDPDTFAQAFMKPDSNLKMGALYNILTSGDTKIGNDAWKSLQKAWLTRTLRGSGDEIIDTLDAWKKAGDEDGLRLIVGDNYQAKIDQMYKIAKKKKALDTSNLFQEMLDEQGTNAELVFNVIRKAKKTDVGASAKIDELILQGGDPFVQSVRGGIIENILEDASTISKETLQKSLDIRKLNQKIVELTKNENLMKFFSPEDIKALQDFSTYTTALAQTTDVGGMMKAGEVASDVFEPSKYVKLGATLIRHKLLAKALSSPQTRAIFDREGSSILEDPIYNGLDIIFTRLLREAGISPEDVERDTIYERYESDEFGNPVPNLPRNEKVMSFDQVPVEVPTTAVPGSAVSSTQVIAPLPTMNQQGAPMNVARAQQAFPFDPIFAAGGGSIDKQGIMNTSRGRQMVV